MKKLDESVASKVCIEPRTSSTLHLSQKCFWFAASISLLVGTSVFSWRVYTGHTASVELGGIKITSEEAEKTVSATRERLLTLRTRLEAANAEEAPAVIKDVLPDFDDVLKTLGVAESALKLQQKKLDDWGDDKGWRVGTSSGWIVVPAPTQTPKKGR